MAIQHLDGIRLYHSLSAGIERVISRQDYLNKINVFPVPDCDTGTNMAYTLAMINDDINQQVHSNIYRMSSAIADAALDSARGNSGAILAQFLIGFSEGLQDLKKISTRQFAVATKKARQYAYDALMEPREGTILTVMADWSEALHSLSEHIHDFAELMGKGLEHARQSLAETPKKLSILARAGVVDAGAQGFVDLLEGIQEFIETGKFTMPDRTQIVDPSEATDAEFDDKYPFCTECTITNPTADRIAIKEAIMSMGGSLVIAGTKTKTKIHIHTNDPKQVIDTCGQFGTIGGEKVDDMLRQQSDAHKGHKSIVVVVDSGCDLTDDLMEKYNIHMVPVRLSFGDTHYVDKVTISSSEFWRELSTNPIHPKSSQPTPGDFRRQYQFLASHYEAAVSIHLPAALSGTYQSAMAATRSVKNFPTTVIDSFNGSIGSGLIAIRAAEAVEADKTFDEVVQVIRDAIRNTIIYIGLDSLDNVVKGGRVSASKKRVANLLNLNPVLTFKEEGVKSIGVTWGSKDKVGKLIRFVEKRLPENKPYRVGISHALNEPGVRRIQEYFIPRVGQENIFISEIGPALGVHSGPGAVVIAIQILEDSLNG